MSCPSYSPLLTDLYQLTMAYGYWKNGMHEQRATFHLSFRKNPFNRQFTIACGLESVIQFLKNYKFNQDDIAYLASLNTPSNRSLFPDEFLDYLSNLTFSCDLDAVAEGSAVFPQIPLLRVEGSLLQCQLLETPLLSMINFQTLIASKAAQLCHAAEHDPVIEFGLRRAQGPDGGLSASRAAYIGGCAGTSNTLAGKLYDIPVKGTHAHSWVTAFDSEQQAFDTFADAMPENSIFLVDTFDTINGIKKAINTGRKLKEKGYDLMGIRLDSGDMLKLSKTARNLLDTAGFKQTGILASNLLDESTIRSLKEQGAPISAWGVGTHLVTAFDQPALDGVYKLSALNDKNGKTQYRLKLSEEKIKTSNPGRLQVRRIIEDNQLKQDIIYDIDHSSSLKENDKGFDLLEPIFRNGEFVAKTKNIHEIRAFAIEQTQLATDSLKPNKPYSVTLDDALATLKQDLINHAHEKKE